MTQKEGFTLMIADDHQLILDGFKLIFESETDVSIIATATDGFELIEKLVDIEPDVIMLDINMPNLDGLKALKEIKKMKKKAAVLIVSNHDDHRLVYELYSMGARGYILKTDPKEELIKAVKIVAQGGDYFNANVRKKIQEMPKGEKTTPQNEYDDNSVLISLTTREIDILKFIFMEYSGKEIAKKLKISQDTVNTHIKNLRKKTNTKNRIGLVKFALDNNIIAS